MKISQLPKTSTTSRRDLLTIVQGGVTKTISKSDLLGALESKLDSAVSEIKSLKRKLAKKTISKDTPAFSKPVRGVEPTNIQHLTTKNYVDSKLFNTIKNDGSEKVLNNLSYRSHPKAFSETDLVDKKFVDNELKNTLKTVQRSQEMAEYPEAVAGECYVFDSDIDVFAIDGPEIQAGDLLICIEDSEGGRHGAVGHQFAVVNTNVVFSTEEKAGILKVATEEELEKLDSEASALTPQKYKRALEIGSEYNRTVVTTSSYSLEEHDKGIIGVDCRRNAVRIILPSIGRLQNPKIVKYIIKDEFNNSVRNNITLEASGGNTIQGARTFLVNTNGASVKLYSDSEGTWYVESNAVGAGGITQGVRTFITNDVNSGEIATSAGAYESVMSVDVDLREYPVGTGFKVVSHCFTAANGNTKTVAIGIDGNQVIESSATGTTAPNAKFVHHEVTVLHSDTPKTMAFGFCMLTQDDTTASLSNNLDIDWNQRITVSVDVNAATAATDVQVYALQVIPLK